MQPFEKADEEIRRKGTQPHRIASSVLGTVTSVGAGIAASKVLPFLSQYIPQSLAIKGLSKIDPRLGAFATKALDEGESFDSVKNFIKDKLTKSESKQNNEEKNIIKKYSPELDKFIQQGVAAGKDIGEIAHAAKKKI